jgi:hypothetical protein
LIELETDFSEIKRKDYWKKPERTDAIAEETEEE